MPSDGQQLVDVEVAVRGAVAVEAVGLVGHAHMQGVDVGVGVDGDGSDTVVGAGAGDAHGDLATVGDQGFFMMRLSVWGGSGAGALRDWLEGADRVEAHLGADGNLARAVPGDGARRRRSAG